MSLSLIPDPWQYSLSSPNSLQLLPPGALCPTPCSQSPSFLSFLAWVKFTPVNHFGWRKVTVLTAFSAIPVETQNGPLTPRDLLCLSGTVAGSVCCCHRATLMGITSLC